LRGPIERLFPNLSHGPRVVIDWVMTIVGAVLIVFAVKTWVVNPYRIPSPSMEPTLHCALPEPDCETTTSDRVLANRFINHFRQPRRGEIVVFTTPKLALQRCGTQGTYVKRLIAVPGDVWKERTGVVYINGKKLNEPYIQATRRDSQTLTLRDIPPRNTYTRIPKGYYLMMGDNRSSSCDSRRWGLVPRGNIIGKVVFTYWPLNRLGSP
jgi:signal peptidase I